jgi:threonine dehydrogenase-like Zn-dependent dehydrogenase
VVNFEREDPVQTILDLTGGIGVDRAIDAVGVDAQHAHEGPASSRASSRQGEAERKSGAPEAIGNCNRRRYYNTLIHLVVSGAIDPVKILTKVEPMQGAIEAYEAFDRREPGWIKVELKPKAA